MKESVIEPANFRLVVQCLNELLQRLRLVSVKLSINLTF